MFACFPSFCLLTLSSVTEQVAKYYEFNDRYDAPTVFIDINRVAALKAVTFEANMLLVGAGVTLNNLIQALVRALIAIFEKL